MTVMLYTETVRYSTFFFEKFGDTIRRNSFSFFNQNEIYRQAILSKILNFPYGQNAQIMYLLDWKQGYVTFSVQGSPCVYVIVWFRIWPLMLLNEILYPLDLYEKFNCLKMVILLYYSSNERTFFDYNLFENKFRKWIKSYSVTGIVSDTWPLLAYA